MAKRFNAQESTVVKQLISVMKQMNASNLKIDKGDLLDDSMTEVRIQFDRNGKRYVFRCDNYNSKSDNLRAAQLSISYLYRALESYGVTNTEHSLFDKVFDNFFIGFEATPDDSVLMLGHSTIWYEILGVKPTASKQEVVSAFKSLAKYRHPDQGGNKEEFIKLRKAYEEALEVVK